MSQSHFFAHLSRLKLINRWPLMRNAVSYTHLTLPTIA